MRHPFYDSKDFPFHLEEGKNLLKTLISISGDNPKVIQQIYDRQAGGLPPLTVSQVNNADIWREVLKNLSLCDGGIKAFIEDLKKQNYHSEIKEALNAVENAQPENLNTKLLAKRSGCLRILSC